MSLRLFAQTKAILLPLPSLEVTQLFDEQSAGN